MRELYILCLEGGLVSPKRVRKTALADFFFKKCASKEEERFLHMQAACQRMRRIEAFLYLAAQNFELVNSRSKLKRFELRSSEESMPALLCNLEKCGYFALVSRIVKGGLWPD
jgi:hypothetical protein